MFVKRLPITADSGSGAQLFFLAGPFPIGRLQAGKIPWTRSQYRDKTD